jgi:hypothetical protein
MPLFHKFSSSKEKSSKKSNNKKSKSPLDRLLPRAPPPGNFNINYDTFEVRIPNYIFGKAIELAGAGGLMAVSVGKRYLYIVKYCIFNILIF